MEPYCEHSRTKIIARDGNVDYVECLDCKKVFEAEDLEPVATEQEEEEAEACRRPDGRFIAPSSIGGSPGGEGPPLARHGRLCHLAISGRLVRSLAPAGGRPWRGSAPRVHSG